jgi:vacuolar-type H+-ATPase subunit C/Vma6
MFLKNVFWIIFRIDPLLITILINQYLSNWDFENLKLAFSITMGMRGSFKALHDIEPCGVL